MNFREEIPTWPEIVTGIVLFGSFILVLIVGGAR
jgi:hypothetical protein